MSYGSGGEPTAYTFFDFKIKDANVRVLLSKPNP